MIERIALITDFGSGGPYLGQMRLLLSQRLPQLPVVELISDLPPFAPQLAAYLIPTLIADMPTATLCLCVVDPGVGGERAVLQVEADGNWFLAPDNGLLVPLVARAHAPRVGRVDWRPDRLSDSFHGRDLFIPLGVRLIRGESSSQTPLGPDQMVSSDWPADLPRILYVDRFGNLMTGLRADGLGAAGRIRAGERELGYARTFCEVSAGTPFWYRNAFGLVELAVNQGRADALLGLEPGAPVEVLAGPDVTRPTSRAQAGV